jgi:L-threonylcarbamoyladenylate synthase
MIQTDLIADNIPKLFYTLADHFFPGPLTIVVPKKKAVPDIASAHLTTIGIRMPNHPIAWKLIEQFGTPLVAPSANLSGRPSPTTAQDVLEDMKGKIPLILDGGPCRVGIESTVIDITTSTPTILRPGHITRDQIEQVIRQPVQTLLTNKQLEIVKAPGMKYRHYAPDAMIYCITTLEELRELLKNPDLSQAMMMTNIHLPLQISFPFVVPIEEQTLFSNFRIADRKKIKHIIIFLDDDTKRNSGLINRIEKATTKV